MTKLGSLQLRRRTRSERVYFPPVGGSRQRGLNDQLIKRIDAMRAANRTRQGKLTESDLLFREERER